MTQQPQFPNPLPPLAHEAPTGSYGAAPLQQWVRIVAIVMVVLVAPGLLVAAYLTSEAMSNDDPLALLGLAVALFVGLWTLVPAVLAGTALAVQGRRPGASRVLVWVGIGWHAFFMLAVVWFFLPFAMV